MLALYYNLTISLHNKPPQITINLNVLDKYYWQFRCDHKTITPDNHKDDAVGHSLMICKGPHRVPINDLQESSEKLWS